MFLNHENNIYVRSDFNDAEVALPFHTGHRP